MKSGKQIGLFSIFFFYILTAQCQGESNTIDNNLGIVVTQNNSYLYPGQEFELGVFQGLDTKYPITKVSVGGMNIGFYKKGMARFKTTVSNVGTHTIPVKVWYKDQKGIEKSKTFPIEYTVGIPTASIGLDRLNILYIGVDNPVTVATSYGGDEKLIVSITGGGGSLAKIGSGKLIVRATKPTDDCFITLQVDGNTVGRFQYRVRQLPKPTGAIGGKVSGDTVELNAFKNQAGVSCYLKDFPFELNYHVKRYTILIYDEKGKIESADCNGAEFSSEARQLIEQHLRPGKIVTISNLFIAAPDGQEVKLLPLLYYIR